MEDKRVISSLGSISLGSFFREVGLRKGEKALVRDVVFEGVRGVFLCKPPFPVEKQGGN